MYIFSLIMMLVTNSFPGHSQILFHSCEIKSGSDLGMRLTNVHTLGIPEDRSRVLHLVCEFQAIAEHNTTVETLLLVVTYSDV